MENKAAKTYPVRKVEIAQEVNESIELQKTLDYQVENGIISDEERKTRIARAIVLERVLKKRYEDQSLRDPLTRLPNRRALEKRFKHLAAQNIPFGVLSLDIDHFKRINDTYGHDAGDLVLIQTGQAIATSGIRVEREEEDLIAARIGGEEFIVLLPGVINNGDLEKVAQRIRLSFQDRPFIIKHQAEQKAIEVTVSIGCYLYNGESLNTTLKKADEALYQAKDKGRNQVVVYEIAQEAV